MLDPVQVVTALENRLPDNFYALVEVAPTEVAIYKTFKNAEGSTEQIRVFVISERVLEKDFSLNILVDNVLKNLELMGAFRGEGSGS